MNCEQGCNGCDECTDFDNAEVVDSAPLATDIRENCGDIKPGCSGEFADDKECRWHGLCAEQYQRIKDLEAEIAGWKADPVNRQLLDALKASHSHHQDYDDYGGYPESELCEQNIAAIAAAEGKL